MFDTENSAGVQSGGHDGRGESAFLGAVDELYLHMSENLLGPEKRERAPTLGVPLSDLPF